MATLNGNLSHFLEDCPLPVANDSSVRLLESLGPLFNSQIPETVAGFELTDEDKAKMKEIWPAGETSAAHVRLLLF